MTDPGEILGKHFGFKEFLPGQREVIETLLAGHSAAAVFPTGGGKSLCYQLPALELDGTTLVVSPLIALMKDQIDALSKRGHRALRLDSSLDAEEYRAAMEEISAGTAKLVYVAPERFNNERFRQALQRLDIALFAVDEAHCISEWGHNFRPDYLKLVDSARQCGAQRFLALTATATEPVLQDICSSFGIDPDRAVRTAFHRPNLQLLVTPVAAEDRFDLLARRLEQRPRGATIVYVTRQRTADELAGRLADLGISARSYHAGHKADARAEVQDWFFAEKSPIVVATIAFGMGIDKPDIRYVYHYSLPKSLENYSQEVGRAGRDHREAICELFACPDDLNALENFVYGDTPSEQAIRQVVEQVLGGSQVAVDLNLYALSFDSDARQIVVRTLLTYLELDGYLEAGTPYYAQFEMHPLVTSKEILSHFEGERRDFLHTLFRHSKKRRKWISLDLDSACQEAEVPRQRAVRALEYLEQKQWIELRATGLRHRYHVLRRPESIERLVQDLAGRFERRERAELARLQDVLLFVQADECLSQRLSAHFGEVIEEPCGTCGWCAGGRQAVRLPSRGAPSISERDWQRAEALRREHPDALGEPRAFARFLCGLSSPRTSRARLMRNQLAGVFAEVPFDDVWRRARGKRLSAG